MNKMVVIMRFLLSLVMLEVIDDEFEYDQVSLNHESLNLGKLVFYVVILSIT